MKAAEYKRDSMGRTPDVVKAMLQNDPKPLKLSDRTLDAHDSAAETLGEYPKILYRAAVNKKGVPCGDALPPWSASYPMPFDVAVDLGFDDVGFVHKGRKQSDGGSFLPCLPYETKLAGYAQRNESRDGSVTFSCDVAAAKAEETELRKQGWVDSLSKLKLPDAPLIRKLMGRPEADDSVDEKPNGHAKG
jgi:hypothetical protein